MEELNWDLALKPLVLGLRSRWKEQEEPEEGPCCKEPRGHPVRRTGMARDFGLLECDHHKDPGLRPSRCPDDCLEHCLSGGVGLGSCLPRQWR